MFSSTDPVAKGLTQHAISHRQSLANTTDDVCWPFSPAPDAQADRPHPPQQRDAIDRSCSRPLRGNLTVAGLRDASGRCDARIGPATGRGPARGASALRGSLREDV